MVNVIDGLVTPTGFAGSGLLTNVSARFTGYVEVPQDGLYTFYTESDDGSTLYIGKEKIVDNDGAHGMQEASGQVPLKAGKHAITILFNQGGGGFGLIARWEGPGVAKSVIPATALSHIP